MWRKENQLKRKEACIGSGLQRLLAQGQMLYCLGPEVKQDIHGGGGNMWQKKLLTSWRPGSWVGWDEQAICFGNMSPITYFLQ